MKFRTAVYHAVIRRDLDCLSSLIDKNRDEVHVLNDDEEGDYDEGDSLLHTAVLVGDISIFKYLCEQGIFKEEPINYEHETPLHVACKEGHKDIVEYLLECSDSGSDLVYLEATDKMEQTPLQVAIRGGRVDIVRCFLEHIREVGENSFYHDPITTALQTAIEVENFDMIKMIVDVGDAIIEDSTDGEIGAYNGEIDTYPINFILQKGSVAVLDFFLKNYGARYVVIELIHDCGEWLPIDLLAVAIPFGRLDIVEYLVRSCHYNPFAVTVYNVEYLVRPSCYDPFAVVVYSKEKTYYQLAKEQRKQNIVEYFETLKQ
jgi:hypothetical protein